MKNNMLIHRMADWLDKKYFRPNTVSAPARLPAPPCWYRPNAASHPLPAPPQTAGAALLVQTDPRQPRCRHAEHQPLQRAPEPAQPDRAHHGPEQDALVVDVHRAA